MYPFLHRTFKASWPIVAITAFFVLTATLLSALVTLSIFELRTSADAFDDTRVSKAADVAIVSLKQRLFATVRDNAIWDDAYSAVNAEGAASWHMKIGGRQARNTSCMKAL